MRRQLNQCDGELFAKKLRAVTIERKFFKASRTKRPLMRNHLRQLQGESERARRALVPTIKRLCRRDCVKGRVNFDRVEDARVNRKHVGSARTLRIEDGCYACARNPVVVIPTLTAHTNAR